MECKVTGVQKSINANSIPANNKREELAPRNNGSGENCKRHSNLISVDGLSRKLCYLARQISGKLPYQRSHWIATFSQFIPPNGYQF